MMQDEGRARNRLIANQLQSDIHSIFKYVRRKAFTTASSCQYDNTDADTGQYATYWETRLSENERRATGYWMGRIHLHRRGHKHWRGIQTDDYTPRPCTDTQAHEKRIRVSEQKKTMKQIHKKSSCDRFPDNEMWSDHSQTISKTQVRSRVQAIRAQHCLSCTQFAHLFAACTVWRPLEYMSMAVWYDNYVSSNEIWREIPEVKLSVLHRPANKHTNNLIFRGLPDSMNENSAEVMMDCLQYLDLSLLQHDIVLCYRIGTFKFDQRKPRPILVKFATYATRQAIWKLHNDFRPIYLAEDYPPIIEERRKILGLYLTAANRCNHTNKSSAMTSCFLKLDTLYINGQAYTVDTVHLLPGYIHQKVIAINKDRQRKQQKGAMRRNNPRTGKGTCSASDRARGSDTACGRGRGDERAIVCERDICGGSLRARGRGIDMIIGGDGAIRRSGVSGRGRGSSKDRENRGVGDNARGGRTNRGRDGSGRGKGKSSIRNRGRSGGINVFNNLFNKGTHDMPR